MLGEKKRKREREKDTMQNSKDGKGRFRKRGDIEKGGKASEGGSRAAIKELRKEGQGREGRKEGRIKKTCE